MRAAGIKIPVPWGHHSKARPLTADDHHFAASRYNAGYLDELSINKAGALEGIFELPGAELDGAGNIVSEATLADGRKVKTAIAEVSAAIDDWKDGRGRRWPDSIIHVALTPLPVVAGQTGFVAADGRTGPTERRFSLSTLLFATEADMADDKETSEGAEGGGQNQELLDLIEALRAAGLTIPDEVTDIPGLIIAVKASGGAEEGEAPFETEGGEGAGEGVPPMVEQPAGTFMSLLRHHDPAVRRLAEQHRTALEKQHQDWRSRRLAKVEQLIARGLQPPVAEELRRQVGAVQLSLDRAGAPKPPPVDAQLSLLDRVLPRRGFLPDDLARSAVAVRPPHEEQGSVDPEMLWHASKGQKGKAPGTNGAG